MLSFVKILSSVYLSGIYFKLDLSISNGNE